MKRLALICGAATAIWAQQSSVFRSETREVLVEAVVTGKGGAYVSDLAAKDFRVFEDNKEQKLDSVRLESASAAGGGRSDLVLFFDETGISAQDEIDLRKAAAQFIDTAAAPNHRIAVVSFDGALKIRQNFTESAGRLKDSLPQPNQSIEGRDAPARTMIAGLGALGQNLGALPGRKIVVMFSGGVFAGAALRSQMQDVIEAYNRSGVAIYPVDVRPVVAGGQAMLAESPGRRPRLESADVGVDLLYGLASGTGGFVVKRTNDLLAGLQTVAAEENAYYVLSYTPPDSKEGKCHTLKVKVERSGTNVRARNSYCSTKPPDLLAGTVAGKDLEKRTKAGGPGNMTASVAIPYFYSSPEIARVHVVMELTPGALRFEEQKGPDQRKRLHAQIDLLGMASTADGAVAARFSDALRFDFTNEDSINEWRAKPLHYEKEFRIAPGKYMFTLSFGQAGQEEQNFGKVTLPLEIDARGGGPGLSGIVLSREMRPAADLGLAALTVRRTPLVADGMQIVPYAATVFRKGEHGYFYFEAYDTDPASLRVRGRVLDRRNGQVKWDTQVRILDEGDRSSMPARAGLPLDLLKDGSYQLEITAADASGKTKVRTADFRVESDFEIQ